MPYDDDGLWYRDDVDPEEEILRAGRGMERLRALRAGPTDAPGGTSTDRPRVAPELLQHQRSADASGARGPGEPTPPRVDPALLVAPDSGPPRSSPRVSSDLLGPRADSGPDFSRRDALLAEWEQRRRNIPWWGIFKGAGINEGLADLRAAAEIEDRRARDDWSRKQPQIVGDPFRGEDGRLNVMTRRGQSFRVEPVEGSPTNLPMGRKELPRLLHSRNGENGVIFTWQDPVTGRTTDEVRPYPAGFVAEKPDKKNGVRVAHVERGENGITMTFVDEASGRSWDQFRPYPSGFQRPEKPERDGLGMDKLFAMLADPLQTEEAQAWARAEIAKRRAAASSAPPRLGPASSHGGPPQRGKEGAGKPRSGKGADPLGIL